MWPDRIVVASPALDDDLGLTQGIEDLAVEETGVLCLRTLDS